MFLLFLEPHFYHPQSENNHDAVREELGGLNDMMQVKYFATVPSTWKLSNI